MSWQPTTPLGLPPASGTPPPTAANIACAAAAAAAVAAAAAQAAAVSARAGAAATIKGGFVNSLMWPFVWVKTWVDGRHEVRGAMRLMVGNGMRCFGSEEG